MDSKKYGDFVDLAFNETIAIHEQSKALRDAIVRTAFSIISSLDKGGKLVIIGNGGSASDASHMAAEFVGRFRRDRLPLPAIALTTDTSLITAIANDFSYEAIFEKQCSALVRPPDVLMAISTSGNSANVVKAIQQCKKDHQDVNTIALTGGSGGTIANISDISLIVPSGDTPMIQNVHRTIIHILCDIIDDHYAKE